MAHINPIQIQKFLKGVDYPASKTRLIENAKNLGTDENVCFSLEQLPEEGFQPPADVSLRRESGGASLECVSSESLEASSQSVLAQIRACVAS